MKRILTIALAALFLGACSQTSSDRSQILKVYNWSDYIDEDILPEFEKWYEEQTGEKVHVIYQLFDINETMLSKIEKGHEDFDVVCPSDYIIERMLKNDLILKIDKDFGDTPNYIDGSLSPFIVNCFDRIVSGDKKASDYAVGYMWGTTGFLYNAAKVDSVDVTTWQCISNPKYSGQILMKDAARDVYSQLLILFHQNDIRNADGSFDHDAMDSLMYDSSDLSLAMAEAYLSLAREHIAGWEADFGKEQLIQEKALIDIQWSGDAMWAIEEAKAVGVDLRYEVPQEGSTMFFDGWVIPKYARNIKAARYFINFMCMPENAVRNSDAIGYMSACGAPELLDYYMDEENGVPQDLTYFFGPGNDSVMVCPYLVPDKSVIDRCCIEHDWGPEETSKLISMWSRSKGESASAFTYVVIVALFAFLIVAVLSKALSKKSRRGRRVRRR